MFFLSYWDYSNIVLDMATIVNLLVDSDSLISC